MAGNLLRQCVLFGRLLRELAWAPPPRRTRRLTPARAGPRLDLRATLRRNLRHGGEPLRLSFRRRKEQPRPLVVICDISGSMAGYARLLLEFVYVLVRRERRTAVFVFSTRLTRITRYLRAGSVDQALGRATVAAADWGGAAPASAPRCIRSMWRGGGGCWGAAPGCCFSATGATAAIPSSWGRRWRGSSACAGGCSG